MLIITSICSAVYDLSKNEERRGYRKTRCLYQIQANQGTFVTHGKRVLTVKSRKGEVL